MAIFAQVNLAFNDDSEDDVRAWDTIEKVRGSGYPRARFIKQVLASETARDFAGHIEGAVAQFGTSASDTQED